MAKFIQSTKNKRKVVDENNYIYDFHSTNTKLGKDYWRCEKRQLCSVHIHTVMEDNVPKIIHSSGEHLHPANLDVLNARKAVAEIKDDAVENSSKFAQHISEKIYGAN